MADKDPNLLATVDAQTRTGLPKIAPPLPRRSVAERLNAAKAKAQALGVDTDPPEIDRFKLKRRVGAGGMGVVYAARDEMLGRDVALKFIHEDKAQSPQARRRLFREAKAMARVEHPRTVRIFEAGEFEGSVYLAMEYVPGPTLRAWLAKERRPWQEIHRVFVAAGEGLAAAHDAGVVHRDFKPDNVLVTATGDPKVADFGVAGLRNVHESWEAMAGMRLTSSSLTIPGAFIGTPKYMSPEQHFGAAADARSDQFSFCVAMWESLYARHPFDGPSLAALADNVCNGRLLALPLRSPVPSWIGHGLRRGLATEPSDRYPDMRELLRALTRPPSRARRLWQALTR